MRKLSPTSAELTAYMRTKFIEFTEDQRSKGFRGVITQTVGNICKCHDVKKRESENDCAKKYKWNHPGKFILERNSETEKSNCAEHKGEYHRHKAKLPSENFNVLL